MKIIDANIHLPETPNDLNEFDYNSFNVLKSIDNLESKLIKNRVVGGCVSILDIDFLKRNESVIVKRLKLLNLKSVIMIDPNDSNWKENIDIAKKLGFIGIKFHAYKQRIDYSHDKKITEICKYASNISMLITICCSYGTKDLYKYNGVRIISEILNEVSTPILALHAGGKLVLDLMLIAEQSKNVYIETSFSLSYYLGSSIESDLAFAIKKLGSKQWMYGSDHPYIDMQISIEDTKKFLTKHQFNDIDIDNIMYSNGLNFFNINKK
jgi:predicted TIM-barrel fold metal-dependent hydrolase|tara:strand:+ start:3797 stop:4597 length:801 start_codon:yes stop_codon:yes gene_type:complete